jgi:uncharacterized membrane protein
LIPDPLRHHRAHREKPLMGDSFAERVSEKVASGMGTVPFIIVSTVLIVAWVLINGAAAYVSHTATALAHGGAFDPEPWVLLNLIFSAVAFFTGALVIISAKATAKRDRATEEASALHREELAEQAAAALQANTELTETVHQLAVELHEHLIGPG